MNSRRVVVTGIGAISCVGNNVPDLWDAIVNGRCGLGKVQRFDLSAYRTQIAGEVKNFDPTLYMTEKEARRLDDFALYAIAATDEALKNAGLPLDFFHHRTGDVRVDAGHDNLVARLGQFTCVYAAHAAVSARHERDPLVCVFHF